MAGIADVVRVNITRETTAVTQAGFGTLLVVGPHVASLNRIDQFNAPAGAEALFPSGDPIREAIDAAFAQSPRIEAVKVGRQQVDSVTISVDVVANNTNYEVTLDVLDANGDPVGEQTVQITSDGTATDLEIAAALVGAIDTAFNPDLDATDNLDGTFTVAVGTSGRAMKVVPDSNMSLALATATNRGSLNSLTPIAAESGANIGAALTTIEEADGDFYGLVTVSAVVADVLAAAAWNETRRRLYGNASGDANVVDVVASSDTTSIAAQLKAQALARTFTIYSAVPESFPDAAWFGKQLPTNPGSSTWKFKTLSTIPVDNLTDTQITNAKAKSCNVYVTRGGVNITEDGVVAEPEFIDVIRFVDWLQARMEERIFGRLVNLPKIPITDAGLAVVEAEIRAQLQDGIDIGGLAEDPQPTVTIPLASSIPTNDKANRTIQAPNNPTFSGTLAGAIHDLTIDGTVDLS